MIKYPRQINKYIIIDTGSTCDIFGDEVLLYNINGTTKMYYHQQLRTSSNK